MKCSDNLQRPVAFITKSLNNTKRNYKIYDKEMLTIVRCLEAQRYFLEGTTTKFEVWTDHKNLEYFMKAQKLNKRQARQILYLLRFNFILKYVPGSKMGKVNSLSRRPDQEVEVEKDNKNKILVKPEWLKVRKIEKVKVIVEEVDLLEKIKQSRVKNNEVIKTVEKIKQAKVKILRDEKWRGVNNVIYKERKVYILRNKKLRMKIIWLYHDTLVGGHGEQQKMIELVTRNFWQPGVTKEVKQYVEGYDTC